MSLGRQIQLRKLVRHLLMVLLVSVWADFSSLILDVLIEPAVKEYKLLAFQLGPNFLEWLMAWPIFLIFIPVTIFPVWRFAYWLNAITYQEAREVDLKRVVIWINWMQGIGILFAIISFIGIITSLSKWETMRSEGIYTIWAFFYVFYGVILLKFTKLWIIKMTALQNQNTNRSDVLIPIIKKATPYFRGAQILSAFEAIIHISNTNEISILGFILGIISVVLNIYILELSLRFARTTAQDNLFLSPKSAQQELKVKEHC